MTNQTEGQDAEDLKEKMSGPELARFELLKELQSESPDRIMIESKLTEAEGPRPNSTLYKVDTRWAVKGRTAEEVKAWDAWVRYELKHRLGIDEPVSYTDDDLARLAITNHNQ